MTARETLDNCRSMAQECAKIAELIEIAEKRIPMGPSAPVSVALCDTPRGGNDATMAAIQRIDGLEEWYRRDHAELVMLVEQVEGIIAELEEWARKLIRSYYIDGKTDAEVAALMGWTRRATACDSRNWVIAEIERNT
ncbi:MAG: hypothetical protein VB087_07880 [Candidatus Limiplasma sp.]|nr:hypothetical protein [Candidatus Limiplasma sp.]